MQIHENKKKQISIGDVVVITNSFCAPKSVYMLDPTKLRVEIPDGATGVVVEHGINMQTRTVEFETQQKDGAKIKLRLQVGIPSMTVKGEIDE